MIKFIKLKVVDSLIKFYDNQILSIEYRLSYSNYISDNEIQSLLTSLEVNRLKYNTLMDIKQDLLYMK